MSSYCRPKYLIFLGFLILLSLAFSFFQPTPTGEVYQQIAGSTTPSIVDTGTVEETSAPSIPSNNTLPIQALHRPQNLQFGLNFIRLYWYKRPDVLNTTTPFLQRETIFQDFKQQSGFIVGCSAAAR